MTKKQEILDYLNNRAESYAPAVREIANAICMSVERTHRMMTVLKDQGLITWEPNMPRTIRLVRPA